MVNWFRTTLLLGIMTVLIVFIGNLLGGQQGMIFAFILAIGMNFFSYWYSDKIVLKLYKARAVTEGESPELYRIVARLRGLRAPSSESENNLGGLRNAEDAWKRLSK
jgi:heat shock protein HtpX